MTVIVVFEVGSVICAAAPTSAVFIAGRAIAGFGSAGIFSGSMMVMIPMIPLPKRPVFQCKDSPASHLKILANTPQPYSAWSSASPPS